METELPAIAKPVGQGAQASGYARVCVVSLGAVIAARPPPTAPASLSTPEDGNSPSSSSALCLLSPGGERPSLLLLHDVAKLNFIYAKKGFSACSAGGSAM